MLKVFQKIRNSVGERKGSEMDDFCVKQGPGLRASAAHLYPDFV